MDNIKEQIKKVMATVFEVPIESINQGSSPDNIESWDSLKHLNLILALEEEFSIVIPDEEVGNVLNFELIEMIIRECKK